MSLKGSSFIVEINESGGLSVHLQNVRNVHRGECRAVNEISQESTEQVDECQHECQSENEYSSFDSKSCGIQEAKTADHEPMKPTHILQRKPFPLWYRKTQFEEIDENSKPLEVLDDKSKNKKMVQFQETDATNGSYGESTGESHDDMLKVALPKYLPMKVFQADDIRELRKQMLEDQFKGQVSRNASPEAQCESDHLGHFVFDKLKQDYQVLMEENCRLQGENHRLKQSQDYVDVATPSVPGIPQSTFVSIAQPSLPTMQMSRWSSRPIPAVQRMAVHSPRWKHYPTVKQADPYKVAVATPSVPKIPGSTFVSMTQPAMQLSRWSQAACVRKVGEVGSFPVVQVPKLFVPPQDRLGKYGKLTQQFMEVKRHLDSFYC